MPSRFRSSVQRLLASRPLRSELLEQRRLLAVTPELIDINLVGDGSDPREMTAVGEIVYFIADSGNGTQSLYRTDGTATGSQLLRSFLGRRPDDLFHLTNVNGVLYFSATTSTTGEELWKSDGTVAGTTLVKDIYANVGSSKPAHLVNVAGTLYFAANDGIHGEELWKSDGTAVGTTLVKDITPGFDSSAPSGLTAVGSSLFLSAKAGSAAPTLWRSQGTAASTIALTGTAPEHLVNVNGMLYFKADDVGMPDQLFTSDGTLAGTSRTATVTVGDGLTNMNGVLYFRGTVNGVADELWRTDGTAPGTIRLATFPINPSVASVRELTVVGNTLYFVAAGTNPYSPGIWKSDGTIAGTTRLDDAQLPLWFNKIDGLTNVDGTLYFRAEGNTGRELWKTNGTSTGTILVEDIDSQGDGLAAGVFHRANVGGTFYFAANDGASGLELWRSDGTSAGTMLVVDLPPSTLGANPREFTQAGDAWYFVADVGGGETALWTTDGTLAGTRQVSVAAGNMHWPSGLINAGGTLYFMAYDGSYQRLLWRSDGSAAGTVAIPGSANLDFRYPTYAEGALHFSSGDPDYPAQNHGTESWKFELTTETATRLADVYPGSGSSQPRNFTFYNGDLYFAANDGTHGFELWKHDGASATLVKDLSPGVSSSLVDFNVAPEPFPIINGVMLFVARATGTGAELWRSDGTEAGTYLLRDINPGSDGSTQTLEDFTYEVVGDVMYFWAYDPTSGQELWRSDGTTAGTYLVKDIRPGSGHSSPLSLTNLNGALYFTADDGTHGYQLWKSDGTAAGTSMVADAFNGNHLFSEMRNIAGTLWFIADDGVHGTEIWTSDGTDAGTKMLLDFTPGPQSTSVGEFLNVNGVPFVTLDDGQTGYELWRFAQKQPGDYNNDGRVDGADFLAWQRGFGSVATPVGSGADGDGDGAIGAGDLSVWKNHFSEPTTAATSLVATSLAAMPTKAKGESVASAFAPRAAGDAIDVETFSVETAVPESVKLTARDRLFAAGDFTRLYAELGEVEPLRERWRRRR